MKPLDEAEARAALADPHWPRRLCGTPGEEAAHRMGLDYLRRAAATQGEDPDAVVQAVRGDEPLARTVRAILGILPDRPLRGGRPSKLSERLKEYRTVEAVRAEGLKGDRLFVEALRRLPECRLTVESLKRTYQQTKNRMTIPAEMRKGITVVVTKPE